MSVELEPAELGFRRPFTKEVSQVLRLHNSNSQPVSFKVKTTAPKQYCVRPNSGKIDAGSTVEVQVLLQAMKEDPAPDVKCRDKFLVQSIAIKPEDEQNGTQGIEHADKASIHEKKIRVVFLPVGGAAVNGVSHLDESSFRGSPTPAPQTPMRQSEASPSGPVSVPSERPADSKTTGEAAKSAGNSAAEGTGIAAAAASVSKAIPTTSDELKQQLAEAKATITRLQAQAQEAVLRQRKTDATNKGSLQQSTSLQASGASGVSVPLAALLCFLCFLIAYFFF